MKRIIFALVTVMLTAGCALGVGYRQATDSWGGAPIEEVIKAWGPPGATEPLSKGQRLYIWTEYVTDTIPTITVDEVTGLTSYDYDTIVCERRVTTDAYGVINSTWNSYECWQSNNIPEARTDYAAAASAKTGE